MRVIGGTFGGRRLRSVEGHATRPTSDRVREALFSRIDARYGFSGSNVLDVFAGTGALTIEAMSRGASRGVCIEVDRRALETLRGNIREFELSQRVRVAGDDYRKVLLKLAGEEAATRARADLQGQHEGPLRAGASDASSRAVLGSPEFGGSQRPGTDALRMTTTKRRFDGVFVDPPYGKGLACVALDSLAALGLVREGGWVAVEVGRREDTPEMVTQSLGVLQRVREDAYGDTKLALYEACAPVTRNQIAEGIEPAAAERDR